MFYAARPNSLYTVTAIWNRPAIEPSTIQGCGLGLDVLVSRWSRDVPRSRLGLVLGKIVNVSVSSREADVSVSAIYVSCPRPCIKFPDGHADGAVHSVNGL